MPFERYDGRGYRARVGARARTYKNGLGLTLLASNMLFSQVLSEEERGRVTFYYDRDTKRIGIKKAAEKDPNTFAVIRQKSGGCTISARSFLLATDNPEFTTFTVAVEGDMLVLTPVEAPVEAAETPKGEE